MSQFYVGQCYYWHDDASAYNNEYSMESYLRISDVDAWTPDGPGISSIRIDLIRRNGVDYCEVAIGTLEVSVFASMLDSERAMALEERQFKGAFREAMSTINLAVAE